MFLRAMAKNALDVEPPLGKIRDFLTDLEPDHPGKIDLKKYGSRIFVDVARIYALATGVHNTNSFSACALPPQRLSIRDEEINAVLEGLNFIQLLRLQHQYLEGRAGPRATT
jgi:CBS domain-containing protein